MAGVEGTDTPCSPRVSLVCPRPHSTVWGWGTVLGAPPAPLMLSPFFPSAQERSCGDVSSNATHPAAWGGWGKKKGGQGEEAEKRKPRRVRAPGWDLCGAGSFGAPLSPLGSLLALSLPQACRGGSQHPVPCGAVPRGWDELFFLPWVTGLTQVPFFCRGPMYNLYRIPRPATRH